MSKKNNENNKINLCKKIQNDISLLEQLKTLLFRKIKNSKFICD